MRRLVEQVRSHLQRDEIEEAFAALIERWRDKRIAPIADLIDELDRHEPALGALDGDDWLAAAASAITHRQRGALLRSIATLPQTHLSRAIELARRWQDPRLTPRIVDLLAEPTLLDKRAVEVWTDIFSAARAQRDARFIEARDIDAFWIDFGGSVRRFVEKQLYDLVGRIHEPAWPEDIELLDELATELEQARLARAPEGPLLDAIYANPDDDSARLVYADWLQQRDDPRGELIALQCREARSDKRARQLAARHVRAWLGPLVHVLVGDFVFRRGFIAAARARYIDPRQASRFANRREWATLEELSFEPGTTGTNQICAAMTSLRRVAFPDAGTLLSAKRPWPIEELEIEADEAQFRAVCTSAALPLLRRLRLHPIGIPEPSWLLRLPRCPAELAIDDYRIASNPRFSLWLGSVTVLPIDRFTLDWTSTRLHFSRDPTGAFTRLDLEGIDSGAYMLEQTVQTLGMLPPRFLTHFDAQIDGKPQPAVVAAVAHAMR